MNVLYVEDDAFTREEIVFSIEPFCSELFVAANGKEGLERFEREPIDLILTDIKMPIMDGIAMIEAVRKQDSTIPIIVMTAFNDTEYLFKAIELGVSHYVTKPVSLPTLSAKLEEVDEQINLRKRAEHQQKLLSQYKKAIDHAMLVCKSDAQGRLTYANTQLLERCGHDLEGLQTEHFSIEGDAMSDADRTYLWQRLKAGEIWHGVIQQHHANGETLHLESTIFGLQDDKGALNEFIAISQDVTELYGYRDFLESELKRNRKNLAQTINYLEQYQDALQTGTAVCHMALDGRILRANETFCNLLGYTPSSIIETQKCAICTSESFDFDTMLTELLAHNIYKQELRYRTRDDQRKTFQSTFVPIRDNDGNVIEILSMHHDISELLKLNEEILTTQHEILYTLGEVAENRSEETGGHVRRVAAYSKFLALHYGLDEAAASMLEMIAPMHDIGKIAIADTILHKPARLSDDEWQVMKTHTTKGFEILSHSKRPLFKNAALVALQHHEHYDGNGYPHGLKGDEIDIISRIVTIADVFDSLGSRRCYKEPWDLQAILEYFKVQRGRQFDPQLTDILLENIDAISALGKKIEEH